MLPLRGTTPNKRLTYSDPFGLCTPWPECKFQAAAAWGAQRGGTVGAAALNPAAGANAASEAFGINDLGEAIGARNAVGASIALAGMLPFGRAARAVRQVDGGALLANDALEAGVRWLGEGYQELATGVFRSADNTRQFRVIRKNLIGDYPHVNFESIAEDGRIIIENSHVRIIDP